MQKIFLKYIQQNKICNKNDKILVAVSGGADSVVLLHLFAKLGFNIAIAHCNFKLRDKDADDDEIFVKQLAEKYNLKIFVKTCYAKKFAKENKISIEMAARQLRYSWFYQIATLNGYTKIATAHHLNDNVETILNNIARKTGIKGLIGIKKTNGLIIRPLLWATKSEILKFCEQNNLVYRTDKTNFETDFVRNKIRHLIIPEFEKINPAFVQNVVDTANNLDLYYQVFLQKFDDFKNQCIKHQNDFIIIDIDKISSYQPTELYLFEFLNNFGFNSAQISELNKTLFKKKQKKFFSKQFQLIVSRNELIICKLNSFTNKEYSLNFSLQQQIFNKGNFDEVSLTMKKIQAKNFVITKENKIAYLDFDKINFPLQLRKWKNGDYFFPLGMKGKKKLSDFFNDNKFTALDKAKIWILAQNNQIIWLIGHRIDDRFKVTEKTKNVLVITAK
jgi:tRNA(Ile)-lysidine synthase